MAVRALTPEQFLKGHQEWQRKFGIKDEPPEVRYLNVENIATMYEDTPYVFDGVVYEVAPVSVPDGARLVRIAARFDAMKGKRIEEVERELQSTFKDGIRLFRKLMKPRHVPRWFWRWCMKNPFRRMSEREFATALAFLALCRMRSRDAKSSGREAVLPELM